MKKNNLAAIAFLLFCGCNRNSEIDSATRLRDAYKLAIIHHESEFASEGVMDYAAVKAKLDSKDLKIINRTPGRWDTIPFNMSGISDGTKNFMVHYNKSGYIDIAINRKGDIVRKRLYEK